MDLRDVVIDSHILQVYALPLRTFRPAGGLPMTHANTLYAVLGVAADASAEEIDTAYRAREQALGGQPDALSLLRVAHDTLRQPDRRAAYDRKLARQAQAAAIPVAHEPVDILYRPRSRSRAINWLILLLAAGGTAAYFWIRTPVKAHVAPTMAATPAASAGAATTAPAAAPSPGPETTGQPPSTPASVAEMRIPDLPAPPPEVPTRSAKQPGFDSLYVGWSAYTIRQRALSGSGVMIGPDRILTNCHVLAGGATNGLVVIHSLTRQVTRVEKYARLDGEDACLLYAPGAGNYSIDWGSSAALRAGDTVHAMGHPGGSNDLVWSEGTFRMRVERGGETFLLSDNYCRPGSSGGPLLDNEGRLVGIVTAVQRFQAKGGDPAYGACISVTEATARALLARPLFPIALAPAKYIPNY